VHQALQKTVKMLIGLWLPNNLIEYVSGLINSCWFLNVEDIQENSYQSI